nr:MAG TPA: tail tape measure [Caudoviricetes sp.]
MPNINTKFTLSGEKEYKQAISEIGSGMKVLDAEMRKVTSAYGKNADSAKLLGQQNDILQRQINLQTEKIRYMQEALKNSVKKTGESSKATMAWQASLQNATAKLNDLNNQMRENEKRIDGEKEKKYRENIEHLSASMDVLDAEMRKVSAKYADNAESAELSAAKTDLLTQKISLQYDKIDNLKAALEEAAENYGSNAVETLRWEKELNNAEAELYKLNGQLKNNTEQIEDTTTATEDAGQSMGNLGDVVNGLTSKLGIQLPDGMKSSINAMGSLDASSLALAGTFAAVAAAIVKAEKAMISMTKESASFADNIITLSMQTGQTTDQLQEFSYATELIDVSVDTLQGSLRKLTNNMQDTMNGTGNAQASFEALGISVTNADGSMRSANDVFYETIDALGKVKNETERDAMSMDIFGRSAQDLNPLIIQGSDTLKAYADEAHNVGYVLDEEALSALGAVDDAYQRLQKTQEGVKNQLSAEFAPYLEEFYGDATQGVKDLGKAIKDSGIVDAFGMLLETVGDILNPMSDLSGNRVPALTNALRPLAEVMALIADTADFFAGLFTLDFKKMGNALGFGYASGNGNKYQTLQDSYAAKSWGSSASDLSKAYEDAIARGDSSTIGITEDEWVRRYLGGNAAGTDNWSGGWTKVNENGLERIYLPSGSRIQTASETRYTSGGDIYIDKVIIPASDIRELNDIVTIFTNERITQRMGAK